ncbi:hypothetical protein [Oryzihumus sp.]|uniref:hypothetical protein n=1 Tax=Oryzihumus sp. TaxID=1968903 RepID=UPI002ED9B496
MLERFLGIYEVTDGPPLAPIASSTPNALREGAGGRTFSDGLYRVHTPESARLASDLIDVAYPDAPSHGQPFGFDWLGRQFCTVHGEEDPTALLFEPGTGEWLEIPIPFSALHDEELVDYADAALARDFFAAFLPTVGEPLLFSQCAGYVTPLFLGGLDGIANLEVTDLESYWHVAGQLRLQTLNLQPGTGIGRIELS